MSYNKKATSESLLRREGDVVSKKGDRTKQFIKEKAKILFAEKGFKIVTMKDICEATGLSRGGLYRHYDSTHVIFSEIISEFLDDQNNLFSESIDNNVPAKEILISILDKYEAEMLDTKGSLSMAIYEYFSNDEISESENLLLKRYALSYQSWNTLIEYGISRGEFKQVDINSIFDLIVFSYQGVRMYSQLMPVSKETPGRILKQIKQLILK